MKKEVILRTYNDCFSQENGKIRQYNNRGRHMKKWMTAVAGSAMLMLCSGCQRTAFQKEQASTEELKPVTYESFEETISEIPSVIVGEDGTESELQLVFWYNDAVEAPYYEAAAADFHNRYGVEIICEYKNDVYYLDTINEAQIAGEGPDVFIASNDQIRKAYLAGLTTKNTLYTDEFWQEHYPEVAKRAFTTGDKQIGYPIYLDTCMMIYDTAVTGQPSTFGSITDFAVNFEDETNSKVLFRWDISDPYCDYLYMGSGAQIFGENGEDISIFDVNNDSVIQNMSYYQSLREYFSLDVDTSTYEQIKSELTNGTLVYGIVRTDVLSELSGYGSTYALCPVPPLSDTLSTQDLSTTYGAFVSSYSENSEYANLFAAFLSYEYAENAFGLTKRVAVRSTLDHADANESSVYIQYCQSVPAPKALESGDFWIYTEICFKNIWNGNDVASEMQELQNQMSIRLK